MTKATIAEIQRVVCARKGLTLQELTTRSHTRRRSWPRQVAVALCREMTNASYPMIARAFGYSDHCAAIFACRKIQRVAAENPELGEALNYYRAEIMKLVASRPPGAVVPPTYRPYKTTTAELVSA
jgi:chromosomal replication initiator protein